MSIVFCTTVGIVAILLGLAAFAALIWCVIEGLSRISWSTGFGEVMGKVGSVLFGAWVLLMGGLGLLIGGHEIGCRIIKLF
jgi:hypothetical protein